MIQHVCTIDVWTVEKDGVEYSVRRHDAWAEGEQEWTVTRPDELPRSAVLDKFLKVNEHNFKQVLPKWSRIEPSDPLYHELVRIVQQHLLRRD
jgi:hypothetical protein